jgi:RNA polymerase sigma-70 factor, ECF subfamily
MDSTRPSQIGLMDCEATNSSPPDEPPEGVEFRSLFEEHLDYVWNSLRRLGVPPRDIEDLAHDVFLKVYVQLDRYEPRRPIRPWLFGFAFRVASDYRRLARNRLELLDVPVERSASDPNPLEHLEAAEAMILAEAIVGRIDLLPRAVFILHELDECPIPEIAEVFGIPVATAYSRLRLARKQFSQAVDRQIRRGAAK